ncbi:hypothetical protein CFOL_v3_17246, partial [Cephalotus follicularis]
SLCLSLPLSFSPSRYPAVSLSRSLPVLPLSSRWHSKTLRKYTLLFLPPCSPTLFPVASKKYPNARIDDTEPPLRYPQPQPQRPESTTLSYPYRSQYQDHSHHPRFSRYCRAEIGLWFYAL